jgi:hypothetical protein
MLRLVIGYNWAYWLPMTFEIDLISLHLIGFWISFILDCHSLICYYLLTCCFVNWREKKVKKRQTTRFHDVFNDSYWILLSDVIYLSSRVEMSNVQIWHFWGKNLIGPQQKHPIGYMNSPTFKRVFFLIQYLLCQLANTSFTYRLTNVDTFSMTQPGWLARLHKLTGLRKPSWISMCDWIYDVSCIVSQHQQLCQWISSLSSGL